MLRREFMGSVGAGLLTAAAPSFAAGYPDKPIRWIVPFPAGGGSDVIARTLAEAMQASLGQTIIIDNRPGGTSQIAVAALLLNKPDGYTVMHGENSSMMWNEHMFKKLSYDPQKDFSYIGAMGRFPVALVVNPNFPAKTLPEFIDYARKNPGKLSYASAGNGTPHHLAMELFKQRANLDIVHVPYKGGAPAMQDVMANQIPMMMLDLASGLPVMRQGNVRPIAVAMQQRASALPDIPTFGDAGLSGVNAFAYHGLIGPAGMPKDVVARLNLELNKALVSVKPAKLFADTGAETTPGTPEEFRKVVRYESDRWGPIIRGGAIRLD